MTHCNQLDYDTLDMVNHFHANMVLNLVYRLGINICQTIAHKLDRIPGRFLQLADELYKLLFVLGRPIPSVIPQLYYTNNCLSHCQNTGKFCKFIKILNVCIWGNYVVGSSKNITVGLLIISRAIDKRFFWPPDSIFVIVSWWSYKPSKINISSI